MSAFGAHDFYISPSQISASLIVFTFAYTTPMWSKVRFNFWASANHEIQLGHFSARNVAFKNNYAIVGTQIQKAFGPNDKPVIRAFINGYMLKSNGIQIAVNPSNLQKTDLSIKVMVGPTTKITSLWISYVAFSPVTASFAAYGGSLMKSKFSGSTSQDISNSLYETPYKLFGLSKISLYGIKNIDFICTISDYFKMAVKSSNKFDSFGIMYIVAGKAPKGLCANCPGNYVYDNTCVASCPSGTVQKVFKDGGVACMGASMGAYTQTMTTKKTTSYMPKHHYSSRKTHTSTHTTTHTRQHTAQTQQQQGAAQTQQAAVTQQSSAQTQTQQSSAQTQTQQRSSAQTQAAQNTQKQQGSMFAGASSHSAAP